MPPFARTLAERTNHTKIYGESFFAKESNWKYRLGKTKTQLQFQQKHQHHGYGGYGATATATVTTTTTTPTTHLFLHGNVSTIAHDDIQTMDKTE